MNNIYPVFSQLVSRRERQLFLNQKAATFWLTGLSGSGKTTIAKHVERELFSKGYFVQLIDGDNVRSGLCNDLGFSLSDRKENIRRIAELTKMYLRSGIICINTFVSPTIEIRALAKKIIGEEDFHEIYVNTPLEVCEMRDTKGLYKKARSGELKGFTGIDSPYEVPFNSRLVLEVEGFTVEESAEVLINYILKHIEL
jgi:adenylylsulfate kinase